MKSEMHAETRLQKILASLYAHAAENNAEQLAENAIRHLNHPETPLRQDLDVRLVKGGTYKIKGYYLEDNELMDIRGASKIITEVHEHIVPEFLRNRVGFDCVLYNGGGNLLALVPADTDPSLGIAMEQEAQKRLVTAQTAYYVSECIPLSSLLGKQYNEQLRTLELALTARKKTKILFQTEPKSAMLHQVIADGIRIEAETLPDATQYCDACRKRLAYYEWNGQIVCGGCLHKILAGRSAKGRYVEAYRAFLQKNGAGDLADQVCHVHKLEDIDADDVAVVYADGNNMGGIIQKFTKLTEMMDFSDFVRETIPEIVYGAMYQQKIVRFEIVAMGGDDIFLLVPGKDAVAFAANLVERYNNAFAQKFPDPDAKSTLSAGICIAKPDTPVKIMLEAAEDQLSAAKDLVKKEHCTGSLSFQVLTTYENAVEGKQISTLLPYSLDVAKEILQYVSKLKQNKRLDPSRLYNISEAFHQADLEIEASMFLDYTNCKDKKKAVLPPEKLGGYVYKDGYYHKDGKTYFIWDDLIDLMQFSREENDQI